MVQTPEISNTQSNIQKLEKVWHSAARFVCGDHRCTTTVTSLLNKFSWQTLERRKLQTQLTVLYKIHYCFLQIKISPVILSSGAQTRNSNPHKYVQVQCRNNIYYDYSFYRRTICDWNSLPVNVLACPSLSTFQSAVRAQHLTPPAHLLTY